MAPSGKSSYSEIFKALRENAIALDEEKYPWRKINQDFKKHTETQRKTLKELDDILNYNQKSIMFFTVLTMTIITYIAVLLIITSQVVDINMPDAIIDRFKECLMKLECVEFQPVDNTRLSIILTGFLAELLLLPQIILKSIYRLKD